MSKSHLIALSIALCLPAVSCTDVEDVGGGDDEIDLAQASSDLVVRKCRHGTVVTTGSGYMDLLSQDYEVTPGAPILLTAELTTTVGSSSSTGKIIQGLYIDCGGPVNEWIQTTQNTHRGDPSLTTTAHMALTTPGIYTCVLKTRATNPGAVLNIESGCLQATQTAAQDWPGNENDHAAVGHGFRIYKNVPQYVLRHDYDLDASTIRLAIRADLELTDIEGDGSGITASTPADDPIWRCNDAPYVDGGAAIARVRVEATQRAVGGWCGATVKGANVDTTITAKAHHQKVFAGLDMPISRATGCLPRVNVKVYVSALTSGNDLCFHAKRYSNTYVYPL